MKPTEEEIREVLAKALKQSGSGDYADAYDGIVEALEWVLGEGERPKRV